MRFDRRYPGVPVNFEPHPVFKSKETAPCMVCQAPTEWIAFTFEAHVCSEDCADKVWTEYLEASYGPQAPHAQGERHQTKPLASDGGVPVT